MTAGSIFVSADVLAQVQAHRSKNDLHEAIKALIVGKQDSEGSDATNLMADMLKKLASDPHLALKVSKGDDESKIKKSYHKMALKYHPDKLKVRCICAHPQYVVQNQLCHSQIYCCNIAGWW